MSNFYYSLLFAWQNTAKDEMKQMSLIKEGCHEKIMAFLQKHNFAANALTALIERGNIDEIRQSILRSSNLEISEKALLLYGSANTVSQYLEHFPFCFNLTPDFVRNETAETVKKCLPFVQFSDNTQMAFINNNDTENIIFLLQRQNIIFSKTQLLIVQRGIKEEIMEMLERKEILPLTFSALLERGVHEEIMCYLQKHDILKAEANCRISGLYNSGSLAEIRTRIEKTLLKRGYTEEIIAYSRQTSFSSEENELIERGNHTEIMFYLSHYRLKKENEQRLISRNNTEELRLYSLAWYPDKQPV